VRIGSLSGCETVRVICAQEFGNGKKMPVVVYYHGGGFVFMKPNVALFDQFCRRLARECHAIVISVHYRQVRSLL
jgi:acetyl esterase/lipase